MVINPEAHIRIARPSLDLAAAKHFYVDGLGLSVLYEEPHSPGHSALLMVGMPAASWHLELTHQAESSISPQPTEDDLLVLYLAMPIPADLIASLEEAGGTRVPAHNSYWDQWGITIADPDKYRLVLCTRSWENSA